MTHDDTGEGSAREQCAYDVCGRRDSLRTGDRTDKLRECEVGVGVTKT